MRKREIHSVAHWAMMFLLLMFPVLIVGLSVFDKQDYTDFTPAYIDVSADNLQTGERYLLTTDTNTYDFGNIRPYITATYFKNLNNGQVYTENDFDRFDFSGSNSNYIALFKGVNYVAGWQTNGSTVYSFEFIYSGGSYLTDDIPFQFKSISYPTPYKTDVNKWVNQFIDLPINNWYKSLMNVIGVGFTNSTVMNVIYVMPVYILWVFIFDVIVDCFLVIIKLPHKLLNRLSGGENE